MSYAWLKEPRSSEFDSEPKYSVSLLLSKDDAQVRDLHARCVELARGRWPDRDPSTLRLPFRDGDEKDDPMYAGYVYMNVKSRRRPLFFNASKQPASDEEIARDAVSGKIAHFNVGFYTYSVSGNNGVGVGLNSCMLTGRGEAIGGGGVEDFDGIEAAPAKPVPDFEAITTLTASKGAPGGQGRIADAFAGKADDFPF